MSNQQPPSQPEVPAELWMLRNSAHWVVSVDDAPNGTTYLVAFSEAEAKAAAKHQSDEYGFDCFPVRVK